MRSYAALIKSNLRHDPLFYASALLMTLACLWPIWYYRFLPMQDYPQHLFLAHVIATYDDPGFNWAQYYHVNLQLAPYSLEYWIMRALGAITSTETAGKLFLSLYVVLMGFLVLRTTRQMPVEHTPWALLLVFPLVFNQTYFLGFQNYLLSLPLLFLALLDLDDLVEKAVTWKSITRHGLILAILFLCHPFTTLVYVALATVGALYLRGHQRRLIAWSAGLTVFVFVAWVTLQIGLQTIQQQGEWKLWWLGPDGLWKFFVMMFTGMRINGGVNATVTFVWVALAAIVIAAVSRTSASSISILRSRSFLWFMASTLGYLALLYWFGYYAYFNLRLAPVAMLALILTLHEVQIARGAGYIVAVLCAALVVLSIQIHGKTSRETEEILHVLNKMEPNALVLPMYLDSNTRVLDPEYFYEMHSHDHSYYHVLVGGGANPFLFPNPMLPVQYRAGVRLPAPNLKDTVVNFDWEDIHRRYRYILVRGDEPELLMRYLVQSTRVVAHSGSWSLFENVAATVESR